MFQFREADRIRQYASQKIAPARRNNRPYVDIAAADVAHAVTKGTNYPNIAQALCSTKMKNQANLKTHGYCVQGKNQSSTAVYRLEL